MSVDEVLGKPFNVASYALLTKMMAQCVGMVADEFVWVGGDCHVYNNHLEGAKEQLSREPFDSPNVRINPNVKDIFSFTMDDFELTDYEHHEKLSFDVAI